MRNRVSVFLITLLVLLSGCSVPGLGSDANPETVTPAPLEPGETGATPAVTPADGTSLPPGVFRNGTVDMDRVVAAHSEVLSGSSYRIRFRRNVSVLDPNATDRLPDGLGNQSATVEYENGTYHSLTGDGTRVYRDGSGGYVRPNGTSPIRYSDVTVGEGPELGFDSMQYSSAAMSGVYSPGAVEVRPIERSGDVLYRIHVPAVPTEDAFDEPEAYYVTVYVDPDGFIRSTTVVYEGEAGELRERRQWEFPRGSLSRVTVTEPGWVDDAKEMRTTPREPAPDVDPERPVPPRRKGSANQTATERSGDHVGGSTNRST